MEPVLDAASVPDVDQDREPDEERAQDPDVERVPDVASVLVPDEALDLDAERVLDPERDAVLDAEPAQVQVRDVEPVDDLEMAVCVEIDTADGDDALHAQEIEDKNAQSLARLIQEIRKDSLLAMDKDKRQEALETDMQHTQSHQGKVAALAMLDDNLHPAAWSHSIDRVRSNRFHRLDRSHLPHHFHKGH